MDVRDIEGFRELSELAKVTFLKTYYNHRNSLKIKDGWKAVKIVEIKQNIVEVHFENGKILNYTLKGKWY